MENASKALIMAGGMLLAILIVSLLIYAWSLFSEYQSSKDSLDMVEDTAKFNEQFTAYDRENIQGYEILSLVNKVIDYNYRKSNDSNAKNNEGYRPITIIINFGDEGLRRKLTKDNTIRLFTTAKYTQSNTVNIFSNIITEVQQIENKYGGSDSATKIAKGIDSIFLSDAQLAQNRRLGKNDEDSWNDAIKKFNSYSTNKKANSKSDLMNEKINIYKYYEYVQFKKAKFNSATDSIKYDSVTGRIYQMEFAFSGNLY